jgi:hypothetical protein
MVALEWGGGAQGEYFRFSAGPDVKKVKLDEFRKLADLEKNTLSYLEDPVVLRELDRCATALTRCRLRREALGLVTRP